MFTHPNNFRRIRNAAGDDKGGGGKDVIISKISVMRPSIIEIPDVSWGYLFLGGRERGVFSLKVGWMSSEIDARSVIFFAGKVSRGVVLSGRLLFTRYYDPVLFPGTGGLFAIQLPSS